jgi:hypothetical protein
MSAVQEAIEQREKRLSRLIKWTSCWPLLAMPTSLIVYIVAVLGVDLALIGWQLAGTREPQTDNAPARPSVRRVP